MVDLQIHDPCAALKIAVIHNKGYAHLLAKRAIIRLAEAHQDQSVHVPHGRKGRYLANIRRSFDHQKEAPLICLARQRVQRRRHKAVLQHAALVFLIIVDDHTDDPRVVPREQNARHIRDISRSLQLLLHALDRFVRELGRFSVDHVGDRRRAEPQGLGDVHDPNSALCHCSIPLFSVSSERPPFFRASARQFEPFGAAAPRQSPEHGLPSKDALIHNQSIP